MHDVDGQILDIELGSQNSELVLFVSRWHGRPGRERIIIICMQVQPALIIVLIHLLSRLHKRKITRQDSLRHEIQNTQISPKGKNIENKSSPQGTYNKTQPFGKKSKGTCFISFLVSGSSPVRVG